MEEKVTPQESWEQLVAIAMIDPSDDEVRKSIEAELASAGIRTYVEGSVVYEVMVSRQHAGKARKVLLDSTRLKGHWVKVIGE